MKTLKFDVSHDLYPSPIPNCYNFLYPPHLERDILYGGSLSLIALFSKCITSFVCWARPVQPLLNKCWDLVHTTEQLSFDFN